ncbi:hypothetical protein IRY55_11375 [Savagea sp. SN6]|uniref:NACHT domain-containing protein n=1 Tax=Savagea serpentis TaxID=2785297 RepID=A0A8J7GE64_9BACL|nr:hypothetical protein [Savagea serpentis]MBF4501966.1 hypothetical protein [Savagea serpentis]
MMGKVAQNALKGYTYQHYIFTLFLAKMDSERVIKRIEAEAITEGNFDDLYIIANENYRVQVKNYANTKLEDILITNESVQIKGNSNNYNKEENNILIINTDQIQTNSEFMGFPSIVINEIVIIPLTPNTVQDLLDEMFSSESREVQIIQFAFSLITSSCFEINQAELPKVIRMSFDLNEKTILIREPLDIIEKGILWIIGKPGVGKSHYVDELIQKYKDAIVYRFWTGSQDEMLIKRLQFNVFLDDLALAVFKSPKNYTQEELIQEILSQEKIIIIDGLDHVENYNQKELHMFIDFIDLLKKTHTVVLSRPLKVEIGWKNIELPNWNFEETALYLSMGHNIYDYKVIEKIFEVTDGYPIITYFIVEHYLIYKEFDNTLKVESLFHYYDTLLNNTSVKSLLAIFATNNSFFLESELTSILGESFMIDAIMDFIRDYPYLFEIKLNRVSLIHDSFNTYLRHEIDNYPKLEEKVNSFVQESLLNGNVNFMSRLSSFELSEDFYRKVLIRYSKFDNFSALLKKTLDFNSITSFYSQLQMLLEQREGVLDIYQYYSFSLIYQMANRNDLIGYDGLVYQILVYMNNHFIIEEELFSSGVMWRTYILLKGEDKASYQKYLMDNMYSSNNLYNLYETVFEEENFFKKREEFPNLEGKLEKMENECQFEKQDILINHMVRVWVNHDQDDNYYEILDNYFKKDKELAVCQLRKIVEKYNIEGKWSNKILLSVNYQLLELGKLKEENIFCKKSLEELIKERSFNGSFDVVEYAKSFIRLANYENKEIDIFSVNRVWTMYYNRKDYSVYTLDVALKVFEKFGYLDEFESINIIRKVMNQSEKGIRHLLTNYIDIADESLIYKLEKNRAFHDEDFPVNIFNLMPEKIDCINVEHIDREIYETLSYHSYSKSIEYKDIIKPLRSKYCSRILDAIAYYDYRIIGWISDSDIEEMITEKGIELVKDEPKVNTEYVPFENGCIHERDMDYIKDNKIGYLEISIYTDGWYSCLPFVDIYSIYDINEIQKNYLKIIHSSIFARVLKKEYIGEWHFLIGNIPDFIDKYNIEINWDMMYKILKWFLKESLICDLDDKKTTNYTWKEENAHEVF